MNICVIASGYISQSKPGLNSFIHEQAVALVDKGFNVHVIAPGSKKDLRAETINGVRVHRVIVEDYGSSNLQFIAFVIKTFRKAVKLNHEIKLDIIHSHFADHAGFAGGIISRILEKPYVLTVHGYDIFYDKKLKYGQGTHLPTRLLTRFILKWPDRILAVSNAVKRQLEIWRIKPQKVVVINNGTRLQKIPKKEQISDFKKKYNLKNKKIILCVSALIKRKGNQNIIKALPMVIDKIPESTFVMIGRGAYKQKLENLSNELGLEKNVMILDKFFSNDELAIFYSICDVFVLMSWLEAFGIVYTEAAQMGKPIIGSRKWGAGDIILDGKTGYLVNPEDTLDLADKLTILLTNKNLRENMGKKGKENVMTNFLWEHNVKNLIRTYNEVIAS